MFIDYPEWAALTGLFPKGDSSHGFPHPYNYEMYRDFQENSINSDVNWIFREIPNFSKGLVWYVDFDDSYYILDSSFLQLHATVLLDVSGFSLQKINFLQESRVWTVEKWQDWEWEMPLAQLSWKNFMATSKLCGF